MKLPSQASAVVMTIMNPQKHRRVSDDRNFVIVARSTNELDRNVELHLTDDELHKLQLDMNEFLDNRPDITRIVSYD